MFIVFIMGIVFIAYNSSTSVKREGFFSLDSACPNYLVQRGTRLYLYTKGAPEVAGVNPVEFDNLEEYVEYMDWLRSKGKRCPVLYMRTEFDPQGNVGMRVAKDPYLEQKGNSANAHPIASYNVADEVDYAGGNMFPSFDAKDQDIGRENPIDGVFKSKDHVSDNATDTHWGGIKHTRNAVKSGKYEGREVYKIPPNYQPTIPDAGDWQRRTTAITEDERDINIQHANDRLRKNYTDSLMAETTYPRISSEDATKKTRAWWEYLAFWRSAEASKQEIMDEDRKIYSRTAWKRIPGYEDADDRKYDLNGDGYMGNDNKTSYTGNSTIDWIDEEANILRKIDYLKKNGQTVKVTQPSGTQQHTQYCVGSSCPTS